MSLLDKFDELEETKEEIKPKEDKKPTPPTNLHPPKSPTQPKPKTSKKSIIDEEGITYDEIKEYVNNILYEEATSSDEKRYIYKKITGDTWRGTNKDLDKALYKYYKERDEFKTFKKEATIMVKEIRKTTKKPEGQTERRGSIKDMSNVIKELKDVLFERAKKLNL